MGRRPCCAKEGLNRGAWTAMEDRILTEYIERHGEGKWRNLAIKSGLKRCGKSCRLRWLNYLRPDIKRGNITRDEEDLIVRLHKLLGNRWSLIAGRLPGRTDNEIKNYWNTTIGKKLQDTRPSSSSPCRPTHPHFHGQTNPSTPAQAVRTRATRCTKVVISQDLQNIQQINNESDHKPSELAESNIVDNNGTVWSPQGGALRPGPSWAPDECQSSDFRVDVDVDERILSRVLEAEFPLFSEFQHDCRRHHQQQQNNGGDMVSPPPSSYNFFLHEDLQDELDGDWITSFLQSKFDLT